MTDKNIGQETQVYIVATPIGNRADFSQRAIDVLKNVDLIACEDCRTSKALLDFYEINTKLVSYHKFNEQQRSEEILKLLAVGQKIALISDAGTPCISDPGRILVNKLFESGIKITSIPGASAITTFLSMIPRKTEEFAFYGFLPRVKSQQEKVLKKYAAVDLVFYESANRLPETLKNILEFRGKEAKITVGRELTKKFEETKTDSVENIIEYYTKSTLKGEIVCLLYADENFDDEDFHILEKAKLLKNLKYSDKDISQILSALYGFNKNKVYKLVLTLQN